MTKTAKKEQDHPSLEQQIIINAQYVKDISFENPKAPQSLAPSNERPKIDLNIDINVQRISENSFEVALRTTAKAANEKDTLFIAELVYAGLFTLSNIEEKDKEPALLIYCPNMLYPFARRIMADLTRDGGFPPLMLDPIDFARLYIERKKKQN